MLNLDTMTRQEVEAIGVYDAHGAPLSWRCSCPQRIGWYCDANNAEKDLLEAQRAAMALHRQPRPRSLLSRVADWWLRRGSRLTAL